MPKNPVQTQDQSHIGCLLESSHIFPAWRPFWKPFWPVQSWREWIARHMDLKTWAPFLNKPFAILSPSRLLSPIFSNTSKHVSIITFRFSSKLAPFTPFSPYLSSDTQIITWTHTGNGIIEFCFSYIFRIPNLQSHVFPTFSKRSLVPEIWVFLSIFFPGPITSSHFCRYSAKFQEAKDSRRKSTKR